MLNRRFALLAIVAALGTVAATPFADFTGPWDVVVEGPQGPVNAVLTVEQKGDSVSGKFESELGAAPIAGKVTGDSIKFAFSINADGQMLELLAVGTLKDKDRFAGTIVAAGMGEFPFAATRQKGN